MNKHTEAIWKLLHPYIASEDGPDYDEEEMEQLCTSVLPNVWNHAAELENILGRIEKIAGGYDKSRA